MIKSTKKKSTTIRNKLIKCPTGIKGFDEITEGGLPQNGTTLVSGNAGSGKTLFGIDFLIKGATDYNEPGILMSFEETEDELYKNVASLNMDLPGLVSRKKIVLENVVLERKDIQETDFNLEGIFVRLEEAIDSIGAKRVVLDSLESLFSGITDIGILRLEIKRLFRWLKEKKVTAIVTGEPGQNDSYTRHGLEEYISDCIILLDNRVRDQMATRRIRVIKYRGSSHGTSEYPFVIDNQGLSVIPITSAGLEQPGTDQKVSTGIPSLDKLFKSRKGYTKGSTILASGTAGSGKTSFAGAFALESCKRGERCLFFSYEESSGQLVQNLLSIGIDLAPWVEKGLLKIVALRPSFLGLEMHLLNVYKLVDSFKPKAVVVDPLTSLVGEGELREVSSMITRMIDLFKSRSITTFFTSLVSATFQSNTSGEIGVSSLIDTWIIVRMVEDDEGRKRTREVFIVKSRGTSHDSDIHKFILSDDGIILTPNAESTFSGNQKKNFDKSAPENEKNK
ncbi:MAG: circadian clock protein KaiC [Saprospiraceae bacterium]|nr:circadian clock protein KaiC [Saprospiraceae bacterium]